MLFHRIIFNQQQIDSWNGKNLQRPETGLLDLLEIEPDKLQAELEMVLKAACLPQEPRYDKEGNLYGTEFYDELKTRIPLDSGGQSIPSPYGVAVQNSFLRAFPTMAASYRAGEWGELDRFAVTLIKIGEPLWILCRDTSGVWSLVRSRQSVGWMLSEHLAWEPDLHRWRQYCCDRKKLMVTDSRRQLEYIDFDGKSQRQLLLMGTQLPLYDADQRSLIAGLPARDRQGRLVMLQFMTKRDGGLAPGPLPFSAQNIVSQAQKMLGEPYGWGGSQYFRDCTSLLVDVFAVFGLCFPRNSRQQLQMLGVEQCPEIREHKYRWIAALPPGSILYFPGHGMLYLGQRGSVLEILHSVYAIGLPAADKIIPYKLRRVTLGNLGQRRAQGQLLLDAVTACWVPEHQKQFL